MNPEAAAMDNTSPPFPSTIVKPSSNLKDDETPQADQGPADLVGSHGPISERSPHNTTSTASTAEVRNDSTTLTIIKTSSLAALRADVTEVHQNNKILRTHNLNLLRQNNQFREHLTRLLKAKPPKANPRTQPAVTEPGISREEARPKQDMTSLLHECSTEWARLEQQWKSEKAALENELRRLKEDLNAAKGGPAPTD